MKEPKLTGNETWVIAGCKNGETVWAQGWGESSGDWWWPITDIELDCGLIGIDVVGMREVRHLDDCARLRIENHTIVENENIYDLLPGE